MAAFLDEIVAQGTENLSVLCIFFSGSIGQAGADPLGGGKTRIIQLVHDELDGG